MISDLRRKIAVAWNAGRLEAAKERRDKAMADYRNAVSRGDTRDEHWRALELAAATKIVLRLELGRRA